MKKIYLMAFVIAFSQSLKSQVNLEWVDILDTSSNDVVRQMTIDQNGNIYVVGSYLAFAQSYNYISMKYDSNGNRLWQRSYNGPLGGDDFANSVATDEFGNVYVTGKSKSSFPNNGNFDCVTIKYDSDGNELWTARHDSGSVHKEEGKKVIVDAEGSVYVLAASDLVLGNLTDYMTIKYNNAGVEQWSIRYNGSVNNYDFPADIKVNQLGDVIVTGRSLDIGNSATIATIEYNNVGVQQWESIYIGPDSLYDQPYSMVLDDSSNVYVTGFSNTKKDADILTIKYNSSGVEQWNRLYQGYSYDYGFDIAVDTAGNVFVCGFSGSLFNGSNYTTLKYDNNGNQQWVNTYDGVANGSDVAHALVLDNEGSIYVTGVSYLGIPNQSDFATLKYDNAGNQIWLATYDTPSNGSESATDIVTDNNGNVYITGTGSLDIITLKYGQSGAAVNTIFDDNIVSLFPNPFEDQITIRVEEAMLGMTYRITNISGKEMTSGIIKSLESTVSLSFLPKGMYFLHFQGSSIGKKLIKI